MMKTCLITSVVLFVFSFSGAPAWAHCEIPCGIYNDAARFTLMEEHVMTISKSMKKIDELSAESNPDWNQITRWVNNKEHHAGERQYQHGENETGDKAGHVCTWNVLRHRPPGVRPMTKMIRGMMKDEGRAAKDE